MKNVSKGWFSYTPPKWKQELDLAPEYVIEETGLTREELEKILEILEKNDIVE